MNKAKQSFGNLAVVCNLHTERDKKANYTNY